MSNKFNGKKVINSIGIGILAVLGSGGSLFQVAAAANGMDEAADTEALTGQSGSSVAEDVSGTIGEVKGEVGGSEQSGAIQDALDKADSAVTGAQESVDGMNGALEDYEYAVSGSTERDTAAENVKDAENAAQDSEDSASQTKDTAENAANHNETA